MEALDIRMLNDLAIAGLLPMFNRDRQLFCYRLRRSEMGLLREGVSYRYTLMTLIGLKRCEANGMRSPIHTSQVFDNMLDELGWIDNIGDLGLLLWTCASVAPKRLKDVLFGMDLAGVLNRFGDVAEGRTMELSWFLSGLTHVSLAEPRHAISIRKTAARAYEVLQRNQGDHGFFGHLASTRSLTGALRGHIGSFADQVYPIYALAKFGATYDVSAATDAARICAESICRVQGTLGQWWWHYNARNGKVFENYPVYSVHQHGMAPMALFALEEAGVGDFTRSIYKGVRWIMGNNELGRDFREETGKVIWRSVYRSGTYDRYLGGACRVLGFGRQEAEGGDLNVTWECRPYELGWLLYALAGREGPTGS